MRGTDARSTTTLPSGSVRLRAQIHLPQPQRGAFSNIPAFALLQSAGHLPPFPMVLHGCGILAAVAQHLSIRGDDGQPQLRAGRLQPLPHGQRGLLIVGALFQISVGQRQHIGKGVLRLVGVDLFHQRHGKQKSDQQTGGDGYNRRPEKPFSHGSSASFPMVSQNTKGAAAAFCIQRRQPPPGRPLSAAAASSKRAVLPPDALPCIAADISAGYRRETDRIPSFPGRGVTKFHAGYPRTAFLGGIPFRRFLSRKPQQAQRLSLLSLSRSGSAFPVRRPPPARTVNRHPA